eukprot:3511044-Lingulodinium_polyedra.AAC.1
MQLRLAHVGLAQRGIRSHWGFAGHLARHPLWPAGRALRWRCAAYFRTLQALGDGRAPQGWGHA